MYVLINKTRLEVIKTSNSVQYLATLVETKYPEDEILIFPVSTWTKDLTVFEQTKLYASLTGEAYQGQALLSDVEKALQTIIKTIPPRGKDPENKPEKTVATKVESQEVVRPKAGTMTGIVWDLADQLSKSIPMDPWKDFKKEMMLRAGARGVNLATVQVQLGKWKASK